MWGVNFPIIQEKFQIVKKEKNSQQVFNCHHQTYTFHPTMKGLENRNHPRLLYDCDSGAQMDNKTF